MTLTHLERALANVAEVITLVCTIAMIVQVWVYGGRLQEFSDRAEDIIEYLASMRHAGRLAEDVYRGLVNRVEKFL
jgi:hypothetical protein